MIAGFVGLVAMAALGFVHAPGHHGGHGQLGHGHGGHGGHAGGHGALGHGHGALGHGHGPAVGHGHGPALGHGQGGAAHGHGGHLPAHAGGHATGNGAGGAGHGHGSHAPALPGQGSHGAPGSQAPAHSDGTSVQPAQGGQPAATGGPANALMAVMPFISPLNWFSWMLGGGALGALAALVLHLSAGLAAVCAVAGALAFNLGVVRPVLKVISGFESKPAENLEGCMLQVVEAVTSFNERGEGLVRVTIDGRSDDILARLTHSEIAKGARVRRGDRLMIEEVDASKNACRVSRM